VNYSQLSEPKLRICADDISEELLYAIECDGSVACDIETSGLNWKTEKIGTCQLFSPSTGAVLIRIPHDNRVPDNLVHLLETNRIRKVFHHAMFDLRFMSYHWNTVPSNVACTKIVSKLLFPQAEYSHSLSVLLKEHLDFQIDKSQQTSNWLSKRLTEKQIRYAVADVVHLLKLFDRLKHLAQSREMLDLVEAAFAHIPTRVRLEILGYQDIYTY